jgi:hypothetical protein
MSVDRFASHSFRIFTFGGTLMSIKQLACIALLCMLVTHSSQAAPTMSVTPIGFNGGNREWFVNIAPDPALFANNPPNGFGGSLAVELAFSIDDPVDLLSVVVADPVRWPYANPGNNPFTGGVTFGTYVNLATDNSFAAYGSTYFTSATPSHFLKITTAGAGLTTIRWLGAYGGNGRIAQAGQNFDLYRGFVTALPEPASCALMIVGLTSALAVGRRNRFA